MADWKDLIDPKTSELLKRAAQCQLELGVDGMIINASDIEEKRKNLLANGMVKKRKVSFRSLTQHEKAICECQNCPLGATRTNFVYGIGNPDADIIFIGEAPGRDEDLKGEPFVGRAGQLLDKILAAINLERDKVYIANILKCRPPNNRDPQPDEMRTCMPYLLEQIRLIKPKIICALGRVAAQALLETSTPLGKLRKQWHSFGGIPFLVTYHPAALLRNPNFKKGCWEDVQILRARYDELTSVE
jgi:DNA polymerase